MKLYDGTIPFCPLTGDQFHFAGRWELDHLHAVMKPNEIFIDTLTVERVERGRSAAYFIFRRETTGSKVIVFLRDALDMMRGMVNGKITGSFVFCKRGANYGCKLVAPPQSDADGES
jgi:hypothetical protein